MATDRGDIAGTGVGRMTEPTPEPSAEMSATEAAVSVGEVTG